MTNALDLAKKAVAAWKKNRGNQSTYLKCQHFDGWYMQWAYEGFTSEAERSIVIYPTAIAAARASKIFTKDLNDPAIVAGDLVYWNWGSKGHVASVIGRDGDRVLVTHTSYTGDVVMHLGANVRVSHADTLSLDVYGVSHTNGLNEPRKGLTPYNINQPKPNAPSKPKPAPSSGSSSTAKIDLRDGWAWYDSASEAKAERNPHGPAWTREQLARSVYQVLEIASNGAIKVRANDGSSIWISPKAKHLIKGTVVKKPSAPAPKPATKRTINFDGRAWYDSAAEAKAERNPHGPKWTREKYLIGTYPVVKIDRNGAVQVRAKDGSLVWVSPRNLPKIR